MSGRSRDPFDNPAWDRPPTYPRLPLRARLVAVMEFVREGRGLVLIRQRTRCIRRHEIHELILTDEPAAAPGAVVDRVAGLAFAEFEEGGVLAEGDVLRIGGQERGRVVGFDETHMPNHLNVVLRAPVLTSGVAWGLALGAPAGFAPPGVAPDV